MSIGAVNPLAYPQAWDVIKLGAQSSPGLCKVAEGIRKHEWDIKKGKGALGATITFIQRPPAEVTIDFYAWTPAHFAAWDTFLPMLKYDPTKQTVQAVDIYHPSLADVDITSVVTEEIGAWIHEGGQLYSRQVKFLEYFPPPAANATSTPTGSQATSSSDITSPGTTPPAAQDADQQQVSDLWQQYQST